MADQTHTYEVTPISEEERATIALKTPEQRQADVKLAILMTSKIAKVLGVPTERAEEGEPACKNGHRLFVGMTNMANYFCDLCSSKVDLLNHPHYMCTNCNWDVCVCCINPPNGEKVYNFSPSSLTPEQRAEYLNSFTVDEVEALNLICHGSHK